MNAIQRAVPVPKVEITKQRALRRQVFGNITPLASRAQHIHEAVHDFPRLNGALASAAFGRRDQGLDMRPLIVRQIAGITQLARLYLGRFSDVHIGGPSSNQAASLESQMIHPIQLLPGRTLSGFKTEI
jgi:hypothetical protein